MFFIQNRLQQLSCTYHSFHQDFCPSFSNQLSSLQRSLEFVFNMDDLMFADIITNLFTNFFNLWSYPNQDWLYNSIFLSIFKCFQYVIVSSSSNGNSPGFLAFAISTTLSSFCIMVNYFISLFYEL